MLIRLASTAVALGLQLGHLYTEGDFDPTRGYLWITVVTCVSQSWALYVLVLFYRCVLILLGLVAWALFVLVLFYRCVLVLLGLVVRRFCSFPPNFFVLSPCLLLLFLRDREHAKRYAAMLSLR